MVTNTKYQGFSLDASLDQVVTILGADFAETYGLTATLITDFLENGEELTFPDYLEREREDMSVISVDIFSICLNDVALQSDTTFCSPKRNLFLFFFCIAADFAFFFFVSLPILRVTKQEEKKSRDKKVLLFSLSTKI